MLNNTAYQYRIKYCLRAHIIFCECILSFIKMRIRRWHDRFDNLKLTVFLQKQTEYRKFIIYNVIIYKHGTGRTGE